MTILSECLPVAMIPEEQGIALVRGYVVEVSCLWCVVPPFVRWALARGMRTKERLPLFTEAVRTAHDLGIAYHAATGMGRCSEYVSVTTTRMALSRFTMRYAFPRPAKCVESSDLVSV